MPLPAIVGTLLSGAADTLTNLGFNSLNRQNALEDWNRNNAYNHPREQVNRLISAGISPHIGGGQAIVASQKSNPLPGQNRINAPAAYQNNVAIQQQQLEMGRQQIENLRVQNEKLAAETENVKKDTQQKGLVFDTDSETMRSTKIAQLHKMEGELNNTNMSTMERAQHIEQMKQQMRLTAEEILMKKTENLFNNRYLAGRNELQGVQINNVKAQTARILYEIEHTKVMTPFHISKIIREIDNLKKISEGRDYENMYAPEYLKNRNDKLNMDYLDKKYEFDKKNVVSPEVRAFLEKVPQMRFYGSMLRK